MGVIDWAVLGLIGGFIGGKIIDTQDQGLPLNIALAVAGAVTGGFLFNLFGASGVTTLNVWSAIVATTARRTLCC